MKNLISIVTLALLVSSCSLFNKPSMSQEEIDAMVAENQALKAQADKTKDVQDQLSLTRTQLDEAMLKLAACEEAAKGKFHVIVGAFKNATYANNYSTEMKNKGYDGNIIAGPYNFNLVTYSSHESLRNALTALSEARSNVIETAWIYIE